MNYQSEMEETKAATAEEITSGAQIAEGALDEAMLKQKYGSGNLYRIGLELEPDDETELSLAYYFKKPKTASYDRYLKTMSGGMSKATIAFAFDNIIPECKTAMENDVRKYPALAISVGEKLLATLGMSKLTNLRNL